MPRLARIATLLFALVGLVTAAAPSAFAHAAKQEAPLQKVCAVRDVHVFPDKPAVFRCLKTVDAVNGIVAYSVSEDHCQGEYPAIIYHLSILSNSRGIYCFWGYGYVGLGSLPSNTINDATELTPLSWTCGIGNNMTCYGTGWVMYYLPPYAPGTGHQFYYGLGQTYNSSDSVFSSTTKVTQVYID